MTPVIEALLERSSEPRLQSPAPDQHTLDKAFACAARAPDHALLRPWRYLVVSGDGLAKLGELFASTLGAEATAKARDKLLGAPLRAPMIIVGIACHQPHPKVPEQEQTMSAAVGMGYLILALQSAGFGAMWRSGPMASHPAVIEGLGLASHELITGFLYTGTVVSEKPRVPRPEPSSFVSQWPF
ncbi:nitroreductase family protein [Marinobacter sp.]|uniref:nitroreductase family protein n=1 Tax=Marinobacter sp. TaxID=50741 RepID=UPI002B4966F3|nr:nitroreductase family protein [Marinobacter sp.]HKK55408.1 nitroreductase family protein [Marinobacter sp.]